MTNYMVTKWTVFVFVAIMVYGCNNKSSDLIQENVLLKTKLSALQSDSIINFQELCPFDFDTLIILKPYNYIDYIKELCGEDILKTEWYKQNRHREDLTSISEDICLLVFTQTEHIVGYFEIDRNIIDFSTTEMKKYSRRDSVFRLESDKNWRTVTEVVTVY